MLILQALNTILKTHRQKSISNMMLVCLFFILLSFTVSASTTWENFGNQMQLYGSVSSGLSYTLFASNYPQGNTNFTVVNIAQGSDITPIVEDLDSNGQNEIYVFKGSNIFQYDNKGLIMKQLVLNSSVCGSPFIYNQGTDIDREMIMATTSGGTAYQFWRIGITNGLIFVEDYDTLDLGIAMKCTVAGLDVTSQDFYFLLNNNTVVHYYPATKQYSLIGNGGGLSTFTPKSVLLGLFRYDFAYGDIDGDNNLELGWVSQGTTSNTRLVVFDVNTQAYNIKSPTSTTVASGNNTLFFANVGSPGSSKEIIYYNQGVGSAVKQTEIYDPTFSNVEVIISLNGAVSTPFVADFDKDGLNEMCTSNITHLFCYDSASNLEAAYPFSGTAPSNQGFIGAGEYSNDNDGYLELLTSEGVWKYSGGLLTLIYNYSGTLGNYMSIPVSIQQKSTYSKDILAASTTNLYYYISSGAIAVCNNTICESGETVYNCPADCLVGLPQNMTLGFIPNSATCNENTDCLSGICAAFICVGKSPGASCTLDGECASADCDAATQVCSRVDIKDNIENSVELAGFRSVKSKMLFALLMIVAFTIGGMSVGAGYGGMIGGALAGFVGFIASLIISIAVFSWVGAFVVFIVLLFVIGAVGSIIYFFSSGG